jgi:branched-chain amino acid aminotransferase
MNYSGSFISIPELPEETFLEGVHTAVAKNLEFVPPHAAYGASGSMYIRPLLFASSAQLGLVAGDEFTALIYG